MSFLAPFLIRTLGPATALACAGALLAPMMSQPSRVYPTTDVVQLIGGQTWPTLLLIALAIVFATAIWLPLAVLTARRGYHAGLTVAPVSILAQAMAPFWLALIVLLLFGTTSRQAAAETSVLVRALLPASALAVAVLGFLAHATYLRAVSRQSLAAESDAADHDTSDLCLELIHDWLDTIGRQAGLLVGALVLVEFIFNWPGLGMRFVEGQYNGDAAFRSVALFDLIIVSFGLTVVFGIGAERARARLTRQRAAALPRRAEEGTRGSPSLVPSEPRWLALLTVALGGLILVVLLILAMSSSGQTVPVGTGTTPLPPGSAGHAFGTDSAGRDMQAIIAGGIRRSLQEIPWVLFAAVLAIPCGLMAARPGRGIEAVWSLLVDGLLTVAPILLAMSWIVLEPSGASHQLIFGSVMMAVLVRLIRDAVRAVWPGERRDAQAAFGAILMGLFVGLGYAIVLDATITYLGFGVKHLPVPSLGEMVAFGFLLTTRAPWVMICPGIALTALAASMILIGYGSLGLLRSCPPRTGMRTDEARLLAEA